MSILKKGPVSIYIHGGKNMSVDIIRLLRKTPVFLTLDSSSLKKISGFFKEKTYFSGELFFKEGTLGDTLFIIKEGAVKIGKEAKEGEEETSQILRREGDIFGESGFLDESPRPVTAQATKETKVLQLSRSDFLTILNDHPLIAYQIVKVLSSRLKQSDLRIIEELKEKNEQLQKAYHTLQEMAKISTSQEWSEKSPEPTGESGNYSDRLLSFSPYAVICTDQKDNITFFNKPAEKEFGYKNEEVKGKPIMTLWSETSWSNVSTAIQEKLSESGFERKEKNFWEGEIIAKKKNGEHFLSYTTISEIPDPKGQGDGKLYINRNVTRKRSEEREERIQAELVIRKQIATEIATAMREKVKRLSVACETLPFELDEINLNKSLKTLSIMTNALDNLRGLLSDLTVVPSSQAKKEPLDLASFFEEELILLKTQEKFRDVTFITHFEKGAMKVEGDRHQLQHLLYAVLDNAAFALQSVTDRVKTTTIEVGCVNHKREVQIQISDNGIGISPANLSKVFKERFTTKKDSLGLGLLSVARIVNDHDGRIEVQSDEGTYALFVIKLPVHIEKPAFLPQVEPVSKTQE
jgi:PAS domain S-box-containing protein